LLSARGGWVGGAITPARIERLFAPLAGARGIVLAVSGGPDSTALLLMAASWAQGNGRPRIDVATVDHGMREGSRAEAEAVGALAKRIGLAHRSLEWQGPKPKSRIQERAREARYQLLRAYAREIGADYIVTAHHADDQTETVLFRLLRGSGIAGLRGMRSLAVKGDLTLARPLLALRKSDLIAYCRSAGESFTSDPSNVDPRFKRTHLRRLADLLAAEGLGVSEIERLSRRAARMEAAVAAQTKAACGRLGWSQSAMARDAKALFSEPMEIAMRLIAGEIARIGAKMLGELRLDALEALAQALSEAAAKGEPLRVNLGGVDVRLRADGGLTFRPESPRRRPHKTGPRSVETGGQPSDAAASQDGRVSFTGQKDAGESGAAPRIGRVKG
jgi:tRNA(Ile)-lysidine synthase